MKINSQNTSHFVLPKKGAFSINLHKNNQQINNKSHRYNDENLTELKSTSTSTTTPSTNSTPITDSNPKAIVSASTNTNKTPKKIVYWGISENDNRYETTHSHNFKYSKEIVDSTKPITPAQNLSSSLIPFETEVYKSNLKVTGMTPNKRPQSEKKDQGLFSKLGERQEKENAGRKHYDNLEFSPPKNHKTSDKCRYYENKPRTRDVTPEKGNVSKYLKNIYDFDNRSVLHGRITNDVQTPNHKHPLEISLLNDSDHINNSAGDKYFQKRIREKGSSRKHFLQVSKIQDLLKNDIPYNNDEYLSTGKSRYSKKYAKANKKTENAYGDYQYSSRLKHIEIESNLDNYGTKRESKLNQSFTYGDHPQSTSRSRRKIIDLNEDTLNRSLNSKKKIQYDRPYNIINGHFLYDSSHANNNKNKMSLNNSIQDSLNNSWSQNYSSIQNENDQNICKMNNLKNNQNQSNSKMKLNISIDSINTSNKNMSYTQEYISKKARIKKNY